MKVRQWEVGGKASGEPGLCSAQGGQSRNAEEMKEENVFFFPSTFCPKDAQRTE